MHNENCPHPDKGQYYYKMKNQLYLFFHKVLDNPLHLRKKHAYNY